MIEIYWMIDRSLDWIPERICDIRKYVKCVVHTS